MGIVFVLSEQFATTGEGLLAAARLDGLKPRHYYYFFFFFLYFFTSKGTDEREGSGRQVGGELPNSRTRQKRRKTGGRTKVKMSARARAGTQTHTRNDAASRRRGLLCFSSVFAALTWFKTRREPLTLLKGESVAFFLNPLLHVSRGLSASPPPPPPAPHAAPHSTEPSRAGLFTANSSSRLTEFTPSYWANLVAFCTNVCFAAANLPLSSG